MVRKYKCLKCGKKATNVLWNPFITYKSNVDCFCLDCYEKEIKIGNWMSNCGYCKNFKTEVCFDCVKSDKLKWSGIKRSELKIRFGKFLPRINKELAGITITIRNGDWIIPNYDIRRGMEITLMGHTVMPFD